MVPPTPKRMMHVKSNRGSLENVAKVGLCAVPLRRSAGSEVWCPHRYLISTRWMSRRVLLRSLGQCCLGLVALLVAGGAAGTLPVSLNCPLPLRRTHPPTLICCFCVFAAMGVTSIKSGRLEVNLSLSGKRGGKSRHLGTILLSAVSGIWRICMVIRSLLAAYIFGDNA
jgi:hypothetical protein